MTYSPSAMSMMWLAGTLQLWRRAEWARDISSQERTCRSCTCSTWLPILPPQTHLGSTCLSGCLKSTGGFQFLLLKSPRTPHLLAILYVPFFNHFSLISSVCLHITMLSAGLIYLCIISSTNGHTHVTRPRGSWATVQEA